MPAKCGDRADGKTVVGAYQGSEVGTPAEQFFDAFFSLFLVEARGKRDQLRIIVERQLPAVAFEGTVALDTRRYCLRAGNVRDLAMAERGQMAKHVEDSGILVVDHRGDGGIVDAPVHCHDRQSLGREPRDRLVLALDAREDQPVHAAGAQEIRRSLPRGPGVRRYWQGLQGSRARPAHPRCRG